LFDTIDLQAFQAKPVPYVFKQRLQWFRFVSRYSPFIRTRSRLFHDFTTTCNAFVLSSSFADTVISFISDIDVPCAVNRHTTSVIESRRSARAIAPKKMVVDCLVLTTRFFRDSVTPQVGTES